MQVTTEKINPCKIALTIEVEADVVATAKEKAFQQYARTIQIPGFRKGKVPPQMARSYVDPDRINQRALETLAEPALSEAIRQVEVIPFSDPELELVEMNEGGPLIFKALVPLAPVVTLGPYKGLVLERRRLAVTDADVERQIEDLRNRRADYPEVTDRTVQLGDLIVASLSMSVEGDDKDKDDEELKETVIEIGKNIPDFDNAVVGMAIGEEKEGDGVYPEDYEDEGMRGKRFHFSVLVNAIRMRVLPELDDDFVQKVHPTAKTVEELRASLLTSLNKAADVMADNDLQTRILGEIVRNSQIHYPDVILRNEMEAAATTLKERLEQENATLEQYLEAIGKTQQEVQAEMASTADLRIRNSLALSEIARIDKVTVEPADMDVAIQEEAEAARVSTAAVRAFLEKSGRLDALRDQVLTHKLFEYLREISTVTERTVTGDELRSEDGMDAQEELLETAEAIEAAAPPPPAAPLAIQSAARPRRTAAGDESGSADTETTDTESEDGDTHTSEHAETTEMSTTPDTAHLSEESEKE